jgi:hypothetical protein
LLKAFINAKTPPTGGDLVVDINRNGISIWNKTQSNRLHLNSNEVRGYEVKFDTINFAEGDTFTIDVDQVGSDFAGQDVTVQLLTLVRNGPA